MEHVVSNQSLNNIFTDENTLYAYFAGVFESNGYIRILEQGGITLIYGGNEDYLSIIRNTLKTGSISAQYQYLIFGNAASKHLKNIYPYLLVSKDLAKLAYLYQDHINRHKGKKITEEERNYRLKVINKIKDFKYTEDLDLEYIDDWIIPYFIGFFDSSAKISIKNKDDDYWINIRLKTKYEQILLFFQEIFKYGYIYPTRSSYFRLELNYTDAYNLLSQFHPYLLQNKKNSEFAIKFYEYLKEAPKPLNKEDVKFIESLEKRLKKQNNQKNSKTFSTISLLICKDLIKKIDEFIKDSEGYTYNSFVKESIIYFYNNKPKIPTTSSICEKKTKQRQINLILDNNIADYLSSKSSNRSALIRKIVEIYLDHLFNIENNKEKTNENQSQDNPLKYLKDIRKNNY